MSGSSTGKSKAGAIGGENVANRRVSTGIVDRGNDDQHRYQFTVSCGYDGKGKQIRKTKTWHAPQGITQKKADTLATIEYAKFADYIAGNTALNENMKFSQLAEQYFSLMANELKPSTLARYQEVYHSKFENSFGNLRLRQFNSIMLSRYFCDLDVSVSTCRQLRVVLSSFFHFAVKLKIINENPCREIIMPKDRGDNSKRKYLELDEIQPFLDLLDGDRRLYIVAGILLFTGLRIGELCGLTWNDIEFDHANKCGRLFVNRNVISVKGKLELSTPKTTESKRCVSFEETAYFVLMEQRKRFEHDRAIFDRVCNFVIYGTGGKLQAPAYISQQMKYRLRNTEFSWVTPHNLRHTYASVLFCVGKQPVKVVSKQLGHKCTKITEDVYIDILEKQFRQTAQILDDVFKPLVTRKESAV